MGKTNVTPLTEKVISLAVASVGVKEQPPGSNRGPEVDAYVRSVGLDPAGLYPWCAAYVHWLFQQAAEFLAVPNPCPRTGSALGLWNHSRPEWRSQTPGVGSVFVMALGHGAGHVGLVKSVEDSGMLVTIEGNTNEGGSSEGVGVFERRRRQSNVSLGFLDFGGKK